MMMNDVKTMTNKAYIVANEQQEREVLDKLEQEGYLWSEGEKPTEFIPTKQGVIDDFFPYALIDRDYITWGFLSQLKDEEIVFDGRKEEKMSDNYMVSQEFMDEMEEWRDNNNLINNFIGYVDLGHVPEVVTEWWKADMANTPQTNNRLIAIIRWVNGEDVFEVEKPKKWVVRSKDSSKAGRNLYVVLDVSHGIKTSINYWGKSNATKFDTKEEAESWTNSHQEVIEVEG